RAYAVCERPAIESYQSATPSFLDGLDGRTEKPENAHRFKKGLQPLCTGDRRRDLPGIFRLRRRRHIADHVPADEPEHFQLAGGPGFVGNGSGTTVAAFCYLRTIMQTRRDFLHKMTGSV